MTSTTEENPAGKKSSRASRLSESEESYLQDCCEEERQRYWQAAGWLVLGIFFLWLCWDSTPFSFTLNDTSSADVPTKKEIARLPGWMLGAYWVWRAFQTAFFDRKRRLLAKLAAER